MALELIQQMGEGKGFGKFLAQGYQGLLEALPPEAGEIAMQVKGLGFPAHDPRAYNSTALSFATSNRGACHLQGFTHVFERAVTEPSLGIHEVLDRLGTEKGKMVADLQNLTDLLLNDQDVHARFTIDLTYLLEDLDQKVRRQAERRLVEHKQFRLGD